MLGVPVGTFIGDVAGWRTAFVVMGVLTVGVLVTLLLVLPPPSGDTPPRVLGGLFRDVNTRFALPLTFLAVLAHSGAHTYVTPFLERGHPRGFHADHRLPAGLRCRGDRRRHTAAARRPVAGRWYRSSVGALVN